MDYFIPASFEDYDYRPSWTGNNYYPTVTIRGIFDTLEKAKEAIKGWDCENDCVILERWLDDDDAEYFDIDYEDKYFSLQKGNKNDSYYQLNKIVDELYSAVYDEDHALGVTDY